MTVQEIDKELLNIIKEELKIEIQDGLSNQAKLLEMGIDSISMMALWVYAEERFSYETDEDALVGEQFKYLNDIAEYIYSKIRSN